MTKHKRSVNNCLLTVLRCLVKPTQNEQNNVHAIMDVCCYYFECSFCDQTSRTRIIATLYFFTHEKNGYQEEHYKCTELFIHLQR